MPDVVEALKERVRRGRPRRDPFGRTVRPRRRASVRRVEYEEDLLGFPLPELLRRIYLEVANGGFGPGYGVMGVRGGFKDDLGHTVGDLYEEWRRLDPADPAWSWPARHLPFCHWGCVVYSVVDCTRPASPVYYVDAGVKETGAPMDTIVLPHKPSLEAWFEGWLDGEDLWGEVWA